MKKLPLSRLDMRRVLSSALLLAGAVLLVYVGVQYGSMYFTQRRLAREWRAQQLNPRPQRAADVPSDGLTRLTIPRIDLDAIVVEGTSGKALLLGPGHMENTPAPGEPGNAVISGHRDTFFRHIYELHKGDSVLVQRDGKTYRYEVTGKEVVAPDDLAVIRPSKDVRLTLITCYPTHYVGPAPKRLVVFARMADQQEAAPAPALPEPARQAAAAR